MTAWSGRSPPMKTFPMCLKMTGRRVLVLGGGGRG